MGGLGSGGHNRRQYGTVEGWRRIDAVKMQNEGVLCDGWVGRWTWTSEDGEENSILVSGGQHAVQLRYRFRSNGGDWQDVSETVPLDRSPRHFGGDQAYFRCPECRSRRRYLIGAGRRFLCRACHGLVHGSSRESRQDRVFRKSWKLKQRIGADLALGGHRGTRPKGMHRSTHARLLAEIDALESAAMDDCYRLLMRIEARPLRSHRPDFWQ